MRSRMIGRDERDASFARGRRWAVGPGGGLQRETVAAAPDAREQELGVAQWIICAENLQPESTDQRMEFLREIDRSGRKVWAGDARAAASVLSFESEMAAGVFVAGKFTEREIDQFGIHPTAFYPLAKGGR